MLSFLDQRTTAAELCDRLWNYGYNAAGEVTRSSKTITSTGEFLAGRNFRYEYDPIGNRLGTKTGGDASAANLRSATHLIFPAPRKVRVESAVYFYLGH